MYSVLLLPALEKSEAVGISILLELAKAFKVAPIIPSNATFLNFFIVAASKGKLFKSIASAPILKSSEF